MEMVGEFNQTEFTWTNDECFAPLPFFPDGTAERRRHSTVHVHDRLLCLPVFLCGKGSKGGAVTAVSLGLQVSYTLDAVEANPIRCDVRARSSGCN